MAFLTNISGIPLYSTVSEALKYASENGLKGYHTHRYKNRIGYMGGYTHAAAITIPISTQTVTSQPSQQVTQTTQPAVQQAPQVSYSSGGSMSSGGMSSSGGGY